MKTKRTSKFFAILLTLAMVIGMFPMAAFAQGTADCPADATCTHKVAIGTTHYDTLAEAITEAQDGDTIKLLGDVTESKVTFSKAGTYTLDLNTFTLNTEEEGGDIIAAKASDVNLNIKNGELYTEATGAYGIYVYNDPDGSGFDNCSLNLESVELTSYDQSLGVPGQGVNSNITLKDSTIISTNSLGIYFPPKSGTLTIDNSIVNGLTNGVVIKGGEMIVKGEETVISATGEKNVPTGAYGGSPTTPFPETGDAIYVEGGYTVDGTTNRPISVTIEDGTITSKNANSIRTQFTKNLDKNQSVSITGGTLESGIDSTGENSVTVSGADTVIKGDFNIAEGSSASVSDGTFSSDVSDYVVSGAAAQKQPDGSYSIVIDPDIDAVASIGNVGYATFKGAIDAANNGDVIILLKDVLNAEGIKVASGKNFTVDFDGHTYTLVGPGAGSTNTETNGFQLLKDSTIVFKNGTINIAPNAVNIKRIIQNYADLTLENMRFEAANQIGGEDYALSFNNGDIVFKGNTTIVTTSDDVIAFDVCNYASYPDVSVTFDDSYTGTVNGRVMYDGRNAEDAKLEINGAGSFGGIDLETRVTTGDNSFDPNIEISGGSFDESVIDYVVENLKYEVNNAETFTYHPTLADAIEAATDSTAVITAVKSNGETSETPKDTLTLDYGYGSKTVEIQVPADEQITLPTPENRTGYTFNGWYNGDNKVTDYTGSTAGNAEVTITAKWTKNATSGGGSVVSSYTLTFDTNGGSAISKITKTSGTTVDLADYKPTKAGYDFAGWYSDEALTEKVTSVKLTKNTTVYAKWTEQTIELPFTDVDGDDWFYDDVAFVFENGMMKGISDTLFAPNAATTRGMIVTILYRLESEPTVAGNCPFEDVKAGSWYEDAIIWAEKNDIVEGYGNHKFGADDSITREQMAAILYRYAECKGYDVTGKADLTKFTDSDAISAWAETALSWANANGLVEGDGSKLMPNGNAERCQVAAILMRFCENIVK